jgi:phage-related baseplate assembly protein
MPPRLFTFTSVLQTMAAGVQAAGTRLMDLSAGSVLRAVLEANAGIALWLQYLVGRVLEQSRAATATAEELDSWMADFGLARLPARAATGTLTFARAVPGLATTIPAGALARGADGGMDAEVLADPAHPAWNAAAAGYAMPADLASLTVPARAARAGAAGNVLPATLTRLGSALPGIETVTNETAFHDGADAETDAALRARFRDYLDTRSRATPRAIAYALSQVQQGLSHLLMENQDASGAFRPGHFVVVVDDGTGAPSASLLAALAAAVEAVRPVGSQFSLRGPELVSVDVTLALELAPDAAAPDVAALVGPAVAAHIATLGIGAPLYPSRLAQVAHAASADVRAVTAVLLNGGTAAIVPPAQGVIRPGVVTVS